MKPLPAAFLERMESLLGAEYPAFLACYDRPAYTGLRVNTLKLTPDKFQAISPFRMEPAPWCAAGFHLPGAVGETRPGLHPHHAAGLYYLQEPSAMAVAGALDPQPGERVLDLAASPGGKTTAIASRMQNSGLLVANEIRTKRIPALASNLERWGARNCVILNETPERLADRLPGFFDRVLLDAPCSGEGMFRKEPDVRAEWDEAAIPGYAERQRLVLGIAARLVRPGGVLAYATCTFAPEEDEGVIEHFLHGDRDFLLDPWPGGEPWSSPARPEWVGAEPSRDWRGARRLWPHLVPGEGHFIARLRRAGGEDGVSKREAGLPVPPRAALDDLREFCASSLSLDLQQLNLALLGSRIYHIPPGTPDLGGLRIPVPGWELGEARKGRFEPSHALALGLSAGQARLRLDLEREDPRLETYLRGGTLAAAAGGWTLVTVDGFPLGWGKAVQGVLKNHYPPGLRRAG